VQSLTLLILVLLIWLQPVIPFFFIVQLARALPTTTSLRALATQFAKESVHRLLLLGMVMVVGMMNASPVSG